MGSVGGILELREIAAMAEPYFVAVSPHNFNSTTVALAATLQASAGMPNFLITEYFVNMEEFGDQVAVEPFRVEDGYIRLPEGPGLGIDLDEEELAKHPYRQLSPRSIRQYYEEGLPGEERQFQGGHLGVGEAAGGVACPPGSQALWGSRATPEGSR